MEKYKQTFLFLSDICLLFVETYPPQVLIKARPDRALISKEYSLQCNSRGNPLPRLFWSKQIDSNRTFEYFPASKQCLRPCPIYSIQNKFVENDENKTSNANIYR